MAHSQKNKSEPAVLDIVDFRVPVWPQGYEGVDIRYAMGNQEPQRAHIGQGGLDIPQLQLPKEKAYDAEDVLTGRREGSQGLWTLKQAQPGRYIASVPGGRFDPIWYEPLKEEGLYLKFANLEPTESAVIGFCSQFGRIGKEVYSVDIPTERGARPSDVEPLDRWIAEVVRMKTCVRLLALSQKVTPEARDYSAREEELLEMLDVRDTANGSFPTRRVLKSEWLQARPERRIYEEYYPYTQASNLANDPKGRGYNRFHLLRKLAFFFVSEHTNIELLCGVSPMATFTTKEPLMFAPRYLLAAMYLQLALDLKRMAISRPPCPVCLGDMSDKRRGATFCSEACKQKNHREKQKDGGREKEIVHDDY